MVPKIDRDLLFLSSENARFKLKQLSSLLKKSSQRLKYALNMFEKEHILSNPYCIFDYSYFGLMLFRVYFKGGYIGEKDKLQIMKTLGENPYITSIYELGGGYDFVIEFESPNPSRFNKELKKIASTIPSLNNYKITLNVVTYIYPREYLLKNPKLIEEVREEIIVGGDREVQQFERNELKLMGELLQNPQMRFISLAEKSDLNIKTVIGLLKQLRKKKVIKGFKQIIDTTQLGIHKFRLFLKLHNMSKERDEHLMDFLLKSAEIVQMSRTVGDWDMEVDLETLDPIKVRRLVAALSEEFKDIIETFNSIEIYQFYKKTFLPEYLFEEEKK